MLARKLKELSNFRCVRCHRMSTNPNDPYEGLQCAHIFTRTYKSVRWFFGNVLCLCASCHYWAHKEPTEFAVWLVRTFGEKWYDDLVLKKNKHSKKFFDVEKKYIEDATEEDVLCPKDIREVNRLLQKS